MSKLEEDSWWFWCIKLQLQTDLWIDFAGFLKGIIEVGSQCLIIIKNVSFEVPPQILMSVFEMKISYKMRLFSVIFRLCERSVWRQLERLTMFSPDDSFIFKLAKVQIWCDLIEYLMIDECQDVSIIRPSVLLRDYKGKGLVTVEDS